MVQVQSFLRYGERYTRVFMDEMPVQATRMLTFHALGIALGDSITEYYLVSNLSQRRPTQNTLRVIWSASPALREAVLAEIQLLVRTRLTFT